MKLRDRGFLVGTSRKVSRPKSRVKGAPKGSPDRNLSGGGQPSPRRRGKNDFNRV